MAGISLNNPPHSITPYQPNSLSLRRTDPIQDALLGASGHARSYHTRQSSHGGKLTRPEPRVKSWVWCPRNSPPVQCGLCLLEFSEPGPDIGIQTLFREIVHRRMATKITRIPGLYDSFVRGYVGA